MLAAPMPTELTIDECWRLLGIHGIGRLAVTTDALPAIVPVRYHVREGRIAVCLGDRFHLAPSVDGAVVAFEADSFGDSATTGWHVHVNGVAHLTPPVPLVGGCEEDQPLTAAIEVVHLQGRSLELCTDGLDLPPTSP
jgi:hypothetical protein